MVNSDSQNFGLEGGVNDDVDFVDSENLNINQVEK